MVGWAVVAGTWTEMTVPNVEEDGSTNDTGDELDPSDPSVSSVSSDSSASQVSSESSVLSESDTEVGIDASFVVVGAARAKEVDTRCRSCLGMTDEEEN